MIANANYSDQNSDAAKSMPLNYAHNTPGSMPGTISIDEQAKVSEITLIDYSPHQHRFATNLTPEECVAHLTTDSVSWV
ncbi:MAG: magnesium and cobalt transport protein CorA, partial [Cyanobacteria bacterium J06598_4]